jgi:ketosteroid isomerase-like protein
MTTIMTRALLAGLLVSGASSGSWIAAAQRATATTTTSDAATAAEIRKLNAAEVQAFLSRDAQTLERLWADEFVVTNPLNRFVTKRQVLEMVRSGVLVITAFDRQIEYLQIYGDTAIVAGRETVTWGGQMPNAGRTESLRITVVWMQRGGVWRQVARHANVVPAAGSRP